MFNLSIDYVTYTISTEMTMPDGKNFQKKINADVVPQIPCLINKSTIKKGTRLFGEEDKAFQSATAKMKAKLAKDAQAQKEAAQKKKADGGTVAKPK